MGFIFAVCAPLTTCSLKIAGQRRVWLSSTKIPNYQYVDFDFSFGRDVVRGRRGIGLGGSNGSTSPSDCAADGCGAAATFAGDFSVSDRADGPGRKGADHSGLLAGPVGLRRGAHGWGDAADRDTLSGASGGTGGDRGTR